MYKLVAILTLVLIPAPASTALPELSHRILQLNPYLSPSKAKAIEVNILKYAKIHNLRPGVIAAVIATESMFNQYAIGGVGEIGLMQLRPEYHLTSLPLEERKEKLFAINYNLHSGCKFLSYLKTKYSDKYEELRWVELYNRGMAKRPKKFPYTQKITKYYNHFRGF